MLWGKINVDFRSVKHIADLTWRVDEVDNTSLSHMERSVAYGAAPQTSRIGIDRRLVALRALAHCAFVLWLVSGINLCELIP